MCSASSSPRRTQSSSAAHSTSSSRDCGKSRAFGTPPTAWPERPARCRNVAIERGEPSWQTRSTSPMSMPSSSDAVATSTFSSPRFRRCSASSRVSFARLPWCAATASLPSRSPRWRAARSAMRRVLTKTSVVRCMRTSSASALVDLLPLLVRHHRLERRRRQLEREVALLGVADVDDRAVGAPSCDAHRRRPGSARSRRSASASPTGRCASAAAPHERLQPLERQRRWLPRLSRRARGSRRR